MKLKHPTHDPKPMDALSYYLQVQREYALAREGYLRIDEADDTYNDLNRKIINAYRERYGIPRSLRCPATPICGRFQAPTQKGGISAPTTKFGFSGQRLALVRESPPAVLPKPKYGAV